MGSGVKGSQGTGRRVLHGLAWLAGTVAVLLTALFLWVATAAVTEWSTYVGGESTTAAIIVAATGLLALIGWVATFVLIRMRHS